MLKKRMTAAMAVMMIGMLASVAGCGSEQADQGNQEHQENQESTVSDVEEQGELPGLVFSTQDIYGNEVTEDIFSEYDLTLVNVFATWCSPCVAEMPELAQLHKNMAEENVNVLAVVTDALNERGEADEKRIELAKQIAEMSGAEFTFMVPDDTYLNGILYQIQAVPTSFFVDSQGMIVGEPYVGARDLAGWTDVVTQVLENTGE